MKRIYKKAEDTSKGTLEDRLGNYLKEKIQGPTNTILSMSTSGLAVLTPLAAATLISSDIQAQCGQGTAVFSPSGGQYNDGQIDVDGDGNPDFDFDIAGGGSLWITPIGSMSVAQGGTTYEAGTVSANAAINGTGAYQGNTTGNDYREIFQDLNSNNTVYVPIRDAAGNLGFIEVTSNGDGTFSVDVTQSGVATGSGSVTAGDCSTLPVTWEAFEAQAKGKTILLQWSTASELNNEGYEIQRSTNGKDFYKVGWQEGSGTTTQKVDYTFSDRDIKQNVVYYYRLKQIDFDGKYDYSKVQTVMVKGELEVQVGKVYPNPSSSRNVTIDIIAKNELTVSYSIINAQGQVVKSNQSIINKGLNESTIDIDNLTDGIYFISIQYGDESEYRKFVVKK